MEILMIEDFDNAPDPVKTEETISKQLIRESANIDTDYVYVCFPIVWNINNYGIQATQNLIDKICKENSHKKLFFVCQHILVNQLNFYNNLVFTPHATVMDSYISIPHYSCTYDLNKSKPWKERQYKFSFVGSFLTHPVRGRLFDYLGNRDDCLVVDTGRWHFENSKQTQDENSNNYIEILGNTKYSLCPRGTGPSTIRIWESIAMGSCPLVISNFLKMPLEGRISNKLWVRVLEKLDNFYGKFDLDEYDNKEYFELFSNDNLYKTILKYI